MNRGEPESSPSQATTIGLAIWASLIAAAMLWPRFNPLPERSGVGAPPFYGRWESHDLIRLIPAALLAVALVAWWPTLVRRLNTTMVAALSGLGSVVWAVTLASSTGFERLSSPLAGRHDYLAVAESLDPSTFLATFVDNASSYPTHVKGHPPGTPMLFRWLAEIGLGGPERGAIVVLTVWGLGVAAVLIATAQLGGRGTMLRASGPVAFMPGVVWVATSTDALFAGLMAISLSVIVIAVTRPSTLAIKNTPLPVVASAFFGGALGAFCMYLSYGLAPLALIGVLAVVSARRWRVAVLAGLGGTIVVAVFTLKGFWWFDGLTAVRGFYEEGISQFRPYGYFTFAANPGNLAIAIGPVAVAGFVGVAVATSQRLRIVVRERKGAPSAARSTTIAWMLLPLGALIAVTAADLSGLSKAEVERIWLPFMMWLTVASAAIVRPKTERLWLAASLMTGLLLQGLLVTPW